MVETEQEIKQRLMKFFGTLNDETRLSIILCLTKKSKTVQDIHNCIGKNKISLSAISHQLSHLNNIGIVEFEKKGREKHFRLSDKFCWCILKNAQKHFKDKEGCPACRKMKKSYNKKTHSK
ncbi:MAG: metalloregulator ArsR/SmtB family transcription factor [Candidatus Woesearchaeota archaeon]